MFVYVTFFAEARKSPPRLSGGQYCPHLVVKGDNEYLGVRFTDGTECAFGCEIYAEVLTLYEGVGYHKLKAGTPFWIMEGGSVVGEGRVDRLDSV